MHDRVTISDLIDRLTDIRDRVGDDAHVYMSMNGGEYGNFVGDREMEDIREASDSVEGTYVLIDW